MKCVMRAGFIVLQCVLIHYALNAQCYGPTSTGSYTGGKQPSASSTYFVNHVFSTFSSTTAGALNGNAIAMSASGGPTTNNIVSALTPGESLVSGTSFPSTAPAMHRISVNSTSIKVTHTFTSNLAAGTHVFLQDVDLLEGWSIVFKDASGTVINPSGFTPFNVSTINLPATFTATTTSLSFKSTSSTNRTEPLVGVIITSALVRSIEFSVTTISSSASNTEIFYSVPLTPSFTGTAASNSAICSGNTLTLTGGTSALASTVPTPVSYIWSGPNSYSNTTASTTASITSVTTAAAGTYSLQVRDAFSCYTSVAVTTAVTINATPAVTVSSNTPVNYSSAINLTAAISGGTTPYTTAWTGPSSFSSSIQNPTVSAVSSANAGIYKLQVTGNNGCAAPLTSTYVAVNSGWIYVHDKNINEESSVNFNFTLKDNSGNVLKTFITNDSATNIFNVYDVGGGHDDGAGTLWAVAGASSGVSNTGTVYSRQPGNTNWSPTSVTTAVAVDGAGLNQFVYVTSSGDGYFYNAGTTTLIFNHSTSHNSQTANASDIAYGGGKVALRNSNGRVYLYTGDFTNDSWTDISANTNIADRIDLSSDGTSIVYILNAVVKKYTIATGITTTYPAFTNTSGAGAAGTRDVAIDDNGTIYATGSTGNTACCGNTDIIYSYAIAAGSWTAEPEARGVQRLTGGPAGQAWGSVYLGSTFPQSIYTRVTDNTAIHLWLDDERVKNSSALYGNSIMMETGSGTYKITTTLPDATWDVGRFNIYDPTGNTTGNTSNNTVTIKPDYSEVVHVEFINEKLVVKVIDNANCTTSILQSFDAGNGADQFGNGTFGTPVQGTAYHYFNQTSPQDGYYYIVKTTDGNWFTTPGITDHSGNGGYFFMVNASYAKDEFYRKRISGLTENLTYRIQFYAVNVLTANPIKPKLRFGMQTLAGTIFGDSTTNDLTSGNWNLYSVSFTVPAGITTADLFLRNENIGGLGNDLAIDDISINPIPTPLVTNIINPSTLNLCVGSGYTISNTVTGGAWSTNDTSAVSINSTTGSITVNKAGAADITYTYVNNIYCVSTATSTVKLSVPPAVSVSASSGDVCKSGTTTLHANPSSGTAPYTYLWSGSYGTISSLTAANPLLTAASIAGSYNYAVQVTDSAGCYSPSANTTVKVHVPVSGIDVSCLEGHYPYPQISEIGGSNPLSWLWSSSDAGIVFYTTSTSGSGTSTSSLRAPYISMPAHYKVVITDSFGCQDSSSLIFSYSTCTILSSSLTGFTAAPHSGNVLLNWATTAETNSKYFIVERSTGQRTWAAIGTVAAAGNSTTIKNYTFTDSVPLAGTNYYRLRQVDADGKYTFSPTRSVLINTLWKLRLYPNPVTARLLFLQSNMEIKTLRVMNINGLLLRNTCTAASGTYSINVANLASGMYFLELVNNKNERLRTPFIKN